RGCGSRPGDRPARAPSPLSPRRPHAGYRGALPGRGGRSAGRAAAVAAGAADPARGRAVRVTVQSHAGPYVVDIGAGLLSELAEGPAGAGIAGRVAMVTDANVRRLWGDGLLEALERAGLAPVLLEIPPGEGSKSLAEADGLWTALIEGGFGRGDTMLALGGGGGGGLARVCGRTFPRGGRVGAGADR